MGLKELFGEKHHNQNYLVLIIIINIIVMFAKVPWNISKHIIWISILIGTILIWLPERGE